MELELPDINTFEEGEIETSFMRRYGSPYDIIRTRLAYNMLTVGGVSSGKDALTWCMKDAFGPFIAFYDQSFSDWFYDGETKAIQRHLISEMGEDHFAPTETELLVSLRGIMASRTIQEKDRVAAVKLAADIMGFMKRPTEPAPQVNVTMQHNVLKVPMYAGSEIDFEKAGIAQQAKLVEDAHK